MHENISTRVVCTRTEPSTSWECKKNKSINLLMMAETRCRHHHTVTQC